MTIINELPPGPRRARLLAAQPFLLLFFALLSLFLVYQWWQTSNDLRARRSELLEVNRDLNTTRKELDDARLEPDRLRQELAAEMGAHEETKGLLTTANEARDALNDSLSETQEELAAAQEQAGTLQGELDAEISARAETAATLTNANQERDALNDALSDAQGELTAALAELQSCQAASLTTCNEAPANWPSALDLHVGNGQFDDQYRLLLLRGERIRRSGLSADVYRSSGALTLPPGRWAFAEIGIGGERATGAGNSELRWEAVPGNCYDDAPGSWYDAIEVSCALTVEWTVDSRYPYAALLLLPIDDLLTAEEE